MCIFYTGWLSEAKRQMVPLLAASSRWFPKYRGDDRGAESMENHISFKASSSVLSSSSVTKYSDMITLAQPPEMIPQH